MRYTIFSTPGLTSALRLVARLALKLIGWRGIGKIPDGCERSIMIAAPHTSNWDFLLFLLIVLDLELQPRVLIKHTLFIGPVGWFLKYCGGIPVDRRSSGARVRGLSAMLEQYEKFVLLITPEGTRSPTDHWKTGFYRMAQEAAVPIIVAYVDADIKEAGIDHVMYPSGDLVSDMDKLGQFYAIKSGVKPQNFLPPDPRFYTK